MPRYRADDQGERRTAFVRFTSRLQNGRSLTGAPGRPGAALRLRAHRAAVRPESARAARPRSRSDRNGLSVSAFENGNEPESACQLANETRALPLEAELRSLTNRIAEALERVMLHDPEHRHREGHHRRSCLCHGAGQRPQTGERLELVRGKPAAPRSSAGRISASRSTAPDRLELARRIMEWKGLPENQAGKTRKLDKRLPSCVAVMGRRAEAETARK